MFFVISNNKKNILHAPAPLGRLLQHSFTAVGYVRRTFLFPSADGSLTLEASIVLPIYFFFLAALIYILNILNLQNSFQAAMEEASRSVNTYAYLSEHFEDMDFKDMLSVSGNDIYFAFNLIKNRTNSSLIKEAFLTDAVKKLADNSYIIGGSNGIHVFLTPTSSDDNMDLNIQYNISLPFLPEKLISISVNQRCFFKTFTGEDITDKTGDYTQYVYITSNSSVYHTSPYCSYLSKYYSLFPASYFEDMIADKNKYTPCHNCVNNTPVMK